VVKKVYHFQNGGGVNTLDNFNLIRKTPLAEEIASQIFRMIQEGRYLPGDKLPTERALSKKLQVSRPIIRDALKSLDQQGLIDIQHGSGAYVSDQAPDIFFAPLEDWLENNIGLIREFYEARLEFEPSCAALASTRGTDEQLKNLRALVEESFQALEEENILLFVGMDIDFHAAIAEMSGNRYFSQMLDAIINRETDLRKIILRLPAHFPRTIQGHVKVLEAIESRNPELARQRMYESIHEALVEVDKFMIGQSNTEESVFNPEDNPQC
jgi:GntR family transcriptional repressor for pyruvate dehydrogenase complex